MRGERRPWCACVFSYIYLGWKLIGAWGHFVIGHMPSCCPPKQRISLILFLMFSSVRLSRLLVLQIHVKTEGRVWLCTPRVISTAPVSPDFTGKHVVKVCIMRTSLRYKRVATSARASDAFVSVSLRFREHSPEGPVGGRGRPRTNNGVRPSVHFRWGHWLFQARKLEWCRN